MKIINFCITIVVRLSIIATLLYVLVACLTGLVPMPVQPWGVAICVFVLLVFNTALSGVENETPEKC